MDNVSFSEENRIAQSTMPVAKVGGITGLLMSAGVIRSEKEAAPVLIGVVVIALIVIGGIWFLGGDEGELPPPQVVPGAPSA